MVKPSPSSKASNVPSAAICKFWPILIPPNVEALAIGKPLVAIEFKPSTKDADNLCDESIVACFPAIAVSTYVNLFVTVLFAIAWFDELSNEVSTIAPSGILGLSVKSL